MNFLLEVTDYTKPVESFVDRLSFGGFMLLAVLSAVLKKIKIIVRSNSK